MHLVVVVAPDSFKGSLPAHQAAREIAAGWSRERPHDRLILLPQADGGEGTLDAIQSILPGTQRHTVTGVTGPDGLPVDGQWVQLADGTAVVELAQMAGLPLMHHPDPLGATTRGLGEVIRAAVDAGAPAVWIALGGSASTDGAAGALSALGAELVDVAGDALPDGGAALAALASFGTARLLPPPPGGVVLLTDVTAPLLGPTGAATVFAPQKGATAAEVVQLEAALTRFATVLGTASTAPGMGAAGGAGYGFVAAWGADIHPGWQFLAARSGIAEVIAGADVLLTGEGRFDEQSRSGKVVGQLLALAAASGVTTGVIAGQVRAHTGGWSQSLVETAGSLDAAMTDPAHWLREAGAAAARALAP